MIDMFVDPEQKRNRSATGPTEEKKRQTEAPLDLREVLPPPARREIVSTKLFEKKIGTVLYDDFRSSIHVKRCKQREYWEIKKPKTVKGNKQRTCGCSRLKLTSKKRENKYNIAKLQKTNVS